MAASGKQKRTWNCSNSCRPQPRRIGMLRSRWKASNSRLWLRKPPGGSASSTMCGKSRSFMCAVISNLRRVIVGTEPLACFLKLHFQRDFQRDFQRELNPFASISMMAARASHISTPRSALPYQCTKHESGSRPCDSGKNRSRNSILRPPNGSRWPDLDVGPAAIS